MEAGLTWNIGFAVEVDINLICIILQEECRYLMECLRFLKFVDMLDTTLIKSFYSDNNVPCSIKWFNNPQYLEC